MAKLSDNFKLSEFMSGGDPEQPSAQAVRYLTQLCKEVLEPLRAFMGKPIQITSGFRSPAHNARIGGAKNSLHTTGMAADIAVGGIPDQIKVAAFLSKLDDVGGIGLYETKGIIHVDIRPHVGKPAMWLEKANGKYVPLPLALRARIKLAGGKV
jgi:uncharacterized protein YcbK (DUF882 family)